MRLIDADKLKADFIGKRYGVQAIEYVIDQQPTVDAIEVVKCKDCKYWRDDDCKNDNHGYCPISENDYCSCGKREEDEIN